MEIREWLRLKHSVYPAGVHPNLVSGLAVAADVWRDVVNRPCTVTSLVDGRHRSDSFHYVGMAADLRTKDLTSGEKRHVLQELRRRCGDGWDIILEFEGQPQEHIHMEWDDGRVVRAEYLDQLEDEFYARLEGD